MTKVSKSCLPKGVKVEWPFQEMRKSREIERKQEKRPKEIHLCYCGNEMRCRLFPFIILLFYR
ncbi:hypothetical protein HMPREF0971_02525 [Segatella oris F0302]|uniref:Uncharacterized protein n=1 Tax=Segatella oris F0302 TaxID=649760 RepID=D1QU42_9BACT|nr:hypothetical protein HMPREF0971_02525 [Segatella oris F0302]